MTRADLLEQWGLHLAAGRRRSPHTVRAYVATAARLLDRVEADDWPALARIDGHALRSQLAGRRAEGIGNVSAAREFPEGPSGGGRVLTSSAARSSVLL